MRKRIIAIFAAVKSTGCMEQKKKWSLHGLQCRCWHRLALLTVWLSAVPCGAQTFALERVSDSLHVLVLKQNGVVSRHQLPWPVYRFCCGDLNGDGIEEAMVGVIKGTRYYPEKARRLFIYKNYHGHVRPLWLGSRLGGILHDFCFHKGEVVSLEAKTNGLFSVCAYRLANFGLKFERYILRDADEQSAYEVFSQYENDNSLI